MNRSTWSLQSIGRWLLLSLIIATIAAFLMIWSVNQYEPAYIPTIRADTNPSAGALRTLTSYESIQLRRIRNASFSAILIGVTVSYLALRRHDANQNLSKTVQSVTKREAVAAITLWIVPWLLLAAGESFPPSHDIVQGILLLSACLLPMFLCAFGLLVFMLRAQVRFFLIQMLLFLSSTYNLLLWFVDGLD